MIARTWHGIVRTRDAESYVEYLKRTGFAAYAGTPGNLGVLGLRRRTDDRAEIATTTWTTSRWCTYPGPEAG